MMVSSENFMVLTTYEKCPKAIQCSTNGFTNIYYKTNPRLLTSGT